MAADMDFEPLPEEIKLGLKSSMKYLTSRFLRDSHWERISEALSNRWARVQSLSAAMKLMEQYGVKLTQEEEERLSQMDESQMIESLVMKMPQQSREQFQHFFLQLQLIVSTATQVRQALETGQPLLVEQALDDAESTGVSQYTLKMAIVQAGLETQNVQALHKAWVTDADGKMARLADGQREATGARRRLEKAQSELAAYKATQNDRMKQVLIAFVGGCATALMHSVLMGWHAHSRKMKQENEIYQEFRKRIEHAEESLIKAKLDRTRSVEGIIDKKLAVFQLTLLAEVFQCWRYDLEKEKSEMAGAAEVEALKAQLDQLCSTKRERMLAVMTRVSSRADGSMKKICFHEWRAHSMECKTINGFEDQVKAAESQFHKSMKAKSNGALHVLTKAACATDTATLHSVFAAWCQWAKEERRTIELDRIREHNATKFSLLGTRSKQSAMRLLERAYENGNSMLYIKVLAAWSLICKIEKLLEQFGVKVDGKRQQLQGVQQLFRNFALQLENNISCQNAEDYSLRQSSKGAYRRGLAPHPEHTSSLPDIHAQDPRHAYGGAGRNMGQAPSRDSNWR